MLNFDLYNKKHKVNVWYNDGVNIENHYDYGVCVKVHDAGCGCCSDDEYFRIDNPDAMHYLITQEAYLRETAHRLGVIKYALKVLGEEAVKVALNEMNND